MVLMREKKQQPLPTFSSQGRNTFLPPGICGMCCVCMGVCGVSVMCLPAPSSGVEQAARLRQKGGETEVLPTAAQYT